MGTVAGTVTSTNGRCGPANGYTSCPGQQCCSVHGWCAGTKSEKSAWCAMPGKFEGTFTGMDNGKYDGNNVSNPVLR